MGLLQRRHAETAGAGLLTPVPKRLVLEVFFSPRSHVVRKPWRVNDGNSPRADCTIADTAAKQVVRVSLPTCPHFYLSSRRSA